MNVGGFSGHRTQAHNPSSVHPNPTHQVHQLPRDPPGLWQEPQPLGWVGSTREPTQLRNRLRAQEGCSPLWEGLGTQPPRTTFCPWENEVLSKGPPTNLNESRVKSFPRAPEHPVCAGIPLAGARGAPCRHGPPAPAPGAGRTPPPRPGPRPPGPLPQGHAGGRGRRPAAPPPRRPLGPRPPRPGRARPLPAPAPPFWPRAARAPARRPRTKRPGRGEGIRAPAAGGGRAGTHRAPRPARARA